MSYETAALEYALSRAISTHQHTPQVWGRIVETGMRRDWSWRRSAERYVEVYQRVRNRHAEKGARLHGRG